MVSINCIPTFRSVGYPLFDGISMPGVEAPHYAAAFKNFIQNFYIESVLAVFEFVGVSLSALLDITIPGTPITIGDVLAGDFETIKKLFEGWDLSLIPFFEKIGGLASTAIETTEAILATFIGGLQTMIKEITNIFKDIKDILVILANAATPGSGVAIQLAFDQFLANFLPGFSLPLELPSWEDIKAEIEEAGELTVENIKEFVLAPPFDILGKLGDMLSLPDPLFPGLSFGSLELSQTVILVQDGIANYFLNIITQFISLIIEPFKYLVPGVDALIGIVVDISELMGNSFTDLVDIIKSIRFCNPGESWYS